MAPSKDPKHSQVDESSSLTHTTVDAGSRQIARLFWVTFAGPQPG